MKKQDIEPGREYAAYGSTAYAEDDALTGLRAARVEVVETGVHREWTSYSGGSFMGHRASAKDGVRCRVVETSPRLRLDRGSIEATVGEEIVIPSREIQSTWAELVERHECRAARVAKEKARRDGADEQGEALVKRLAALGVTASYQEYRTGYQGSARRHERIEIEAKDFAELGRLILAAEQAPVEFEPEDEG